MATKPKPVEGSATLRCAIQVCCECIKRIGNPQKKLKGVREEAELLIYDLLWEILELAEAVEKEHGRDALPCRSELSQAYLAYDKIIGAEWCRRES
jgi:hypothetical protein